MNLPSGPIVVALGGNAISPDPASDTIDNQFAAMRSTADRLLHLIQAGWEHMVITHGNGPQVGNVLRRVELAKDVAPWLPLDVCVADTQGGMGYMIQQCIQNALRGAGLATPVAALITQVVVDPDDPAFRTPTKSIGPQHRLVASPRPRQVVEAASIGRLVEAGTIVIAGGGGGVPVVLGGTGLTGVEAVVDKDLTSALIARAIGASTLLILTETDAVYLGYGTPESRPIGEVSGEEMRGLIEAGEFAEGTMKPKVQAAVDFISAGGQLAVIAALDDLAEACEGSAGTRIVPDPRTPRSDPRTPRSDPRTPRSRREKPHI